MPGRAPTSTTASTRTWSSGATPSSTTWYLPTAPAATVCSTPVPSARPSRSWSSTTATRTLTSRGSDLSGCSRISRSGRSTWSRSLWTKQTVLGWNYLILSDVGKAVWSFCQLHLSFALVNWKKINKKIVI